MSKLILPYHARPDTLAYLKGQPLFVAKSMRDVEVVDAAKVVEHYLNSHSLVHPETEAITFYSGNAVWAELCRNFALDEPLPVAAKALADQYIASASEAAQRLFYYLFLIITRESRHVYLGQSFVAKLIATHGQLYADFNKYMHTASGSMHAKDKFLAKPPQMKLGAYADAVEWTFRHGSCSGGFGGKPWAEIAKVFKDLVDGTFSPEMATDVSWALCHNNGPIFNKAMTYHGYNGQKIKTILDVQRSGQIPELVIDPSSVGSQYVSVEAEKMVSGARNLFPKAFGTTVDWVKVEKAGAVQSYGALKAAQAQSAALSGKKVFYVTPGQWVEVIERQEAA
jgi:hypothetical protein